MKITGATLFSGGGGVDIGMQMAGIDPVWGIEINDKIAAVARINGLHISTGDVTKEDPANYAKVNILHASPPCINASTIKVNGKETELDKQLAESTCNFIEAIKPDCFTLENVQGYLKFDSFQLILKKLQSLGYYIWHGILNAADFGVPQSRKRLVLIATIKEINFDFPKYALVYWNDVVIFTPEEEISFDKLPNWIHWYLPDNELDFWGMFNANSRNRSQKGKGVCYKNELSKTLVAGTCGKACFSRINGKYYKSSAENMKRIQSFPENYKFTGIRSLDFKIIGNSVPPLMYSRILKHVLTQLYDL